MSRKINYVGPNCGRHVDYDESISRIILRACGYAALAFGYGTVIWFVVASLFAIDGPK